MVAASHSDSRRKLVHLVQLHLESVEVFRY